MTSLIVDTGNLVKTLNILGEYSLRYSPSTRVANYSHSTALEEILCSCDFADSLVLSLHSLGFLKECRSDFNEI